MTATGEGSEGGGDLLQVLRRVAGTAGTAELGLEKLVTAPGHEEAGRAGAAERAWASCGPWPRPDEAKRANEAGVMSGQTGGMSGKNDSNGGGE